MSEVYLASLDTDKTRKEIGATILVNSGIYVYIYIIYVCYTDYIFLYSLKRKCRNVACCAVVQKTAYSNLRIAIG